MSKRRYRSNYLSISQARFIDDILVGVDCLCPFCPGQIGDEINALSFILYVFYEERQKLIGNSPVYSNYPDIYQVQKLLHPENSNDLKKIIQFIDIIMKMFEHRNDPDISFDW